MTTECLIMNQLYDFRVQALVLMPNHFHLIATVANSEFDLGKVMQQFMSSITKQCNQISNRSGRLFSDKYYRSIILSSRYYGHVLKYVYQNPVRGKICDRVEQYPFSTATGLIGVAYLPIPIFLTECALEMNIPDPDHRFEWLQWLNQPFPGEAENLIRKLLKKSKVKVLIDRNNRRANPMLATLI